VALILVDAAGQNTIVVASGANQEFPPGDLAPHQAAFREAKVVGMQCEIPVPTVVAAISLSRAAGALTVLNAAPALPALPDEAYQVDYLVVNEQEAEWLTGVPNGSAEAGIEAAQVLRRRGPACAVVTLGALGCVYATASACGHVRTPQVPVVDTTAAGDAFIGGLMAAIIEGLPLEAALRFANCAGALAVTKLGAQPSLPDRRSVVELLHQFDLGAIASSDTPVEVR